MFSCVFLEVRYICAFEIHDKKVLSVIDMISVDEFAHLEDPLDALQLSQEVILLYQDAFSFIWLFHFDSDFGLLDDVKCFVDG